MGRKRGKDQILRCILEVCAGVGGRLRRRLFISAAEISILWCHYLELLVRNELAMRVEGGAPRYKTTAKGMESLRHSGSGKRSCDCHKSSLGFLATIEKV